MLRISFDALGDKYEATPTSDGWSAFEGADGTRLEVSPRGSVLLVRFSGGVGGLAASFGELWRLHEESRGVAVHEGVPAGDDYDALIEGATWEGGLFAQVASMFGGFGGAKSDAEPVEAASEGDEAGEGEAKESEGDAFDEVANKLMSAVAKRSSRKVLAARLAAEKGDKDLGDVLDAMEAPDTEGDDALVDEVQGRFGFNPEQEEMAALLRGKLDSVDLEGEGDEGDEAKGEEPKADEQS